MAVGTVVSAVFLVYCTGFSASHNDVSIVTVSQLREEMKSLLYEALAPGHTSSHPAWSCQEILQLAPQSPSGLYWISGTDNKPKHMYCEMEPICNATGWMRLASINMTDTSSTCPPGLRTLTSPRRLCAMNIDGGGCSSVVFPVQGVEYSRVCGKIIGYQQGSPDGFIFDSQTTIDSLYVDGISITHGKSPRKHIWTFVAEHNSNSNNVCPCTNTRNSPPPAVPDFVGHDYFCDTGSENLWDGAGCDQYSTCCSWNSPPWFRKQISPSTSDNIEMRLCCDQDRNDEDMNFELLEMYVQ